MKKVGFIFEKMLDFRNLLWYVVVLTGGATHEQPNKRTMARKHNFARGQPNQLQRDEGTAWIHSKASLVIRKKLYGRAERNIRKVPDCWSEYMSLAEVAIFEYAFKLSMQIGIETLTT